MAALVPLSLDAEKFAKLQKAGDLAGVVDFFGGSRVAERQAWEKTALVAERATRREWGVDERKWNRGAWEVSRLAMLACAPWPKLRGLRWEMSGSHFRDAEWSEWWRQALRLVEILRPNWVDDWAELLLRQELGHWFFVRELVRRKICRRPACPQYTHGLMWTMRWRFHTYLPKKGGGAQSRFATVADALLDDPGLLQDEVWRLFEVAGTSKCNLQALEPTQGTNWRENTKIPAETEELSWRYALVQLAARGKLPRVRLLDASLSALTRDFEAHHAGWFFRLHDDLEPTAKERGERRETYLKLIASLQANVAAWALQTVADLDKADPIPAAELLQHLDPAFSFESKGGVKLAVQLAGRAAGREPRRQAELLQHATAALACQAADVQGAVLKLLEQFGDRGDTALMKALSGRKELIVPSLRARFVEWGLEKASIPATARPGAGTMPPAPRPQADAPLRPSRRLSPISTFDELVKRATFALEHPHDIDEVEQVLDGLARLGAKKPVDFTARTAELGRLIVRAGWPHLTRSPEGVAAQDFLPECPPERLMSVPMLLGAVLESWRVGRVLLRPLEEPDDLNQAHRFLYQRLHGIAVVMQRGVALPLLSAPTHRGGWIEPGVFVARLQAWEQSGETGDPHDFCLALLRLAPDGRERALAGMKGLTGETSDAARYALGDDEVMIGGNAAVWIAAARARSPFLDDPAVERRHPGRGPDAGCVAKIGWISERTTEHYKSPMEGAVAAMLGMKPNPKRAFQLDSLALSFSPGLPEQLGGAPLPVLLHGPWEGDGLNYREEAGILRWAFTLWPSSREPIFGALVLWLMGSTQAFTYRQGYRHVFMETAFASLDDPATRLGPMASLLQALALLSPDAECRGLGARSLGLLVASNRFSAPALGVTLSRLLDTTIGKAARLAPALAEVAHISPVHAAAVRALIEETLAGDPKQAPDDLAQLLDLFLELVTGSGGSLQHPAARAYLQAIPAGNRKAKLAQRLLSA